MTSISVLKLTSACVATLSTWLIIGERISVISAGTLAKRIASMFSMRESPIPHTPARSNEFATSVEPSVALVTPVTEIPRWASRLTSMLALWWIFSRSISSRGAGIMR